MERPGIDETEIAARYQPDMSRVVTVQFIANNNLGMPWEFGPSVEHAGAPRKIYATSFKARNPTGHDMVGQAVPSVAPNKAGRYFNKTECFCFNQQPLAAGEARTCRYASSSTQTCRGCDNAHPGIHGIRRDAGGDELSLFGAWTDRQMRNHFNKTQSF